MKVICSEIHPWQTLTIGNSVVHFAGYISNLEQALLNLTPETFPDFLEEQKTCFGIIIQSSNTIMAAVDRVRGYPLFYSSDLETLTNHADNIDNTLNKSNYNEQAALEFAMSGYTVGSKTLHKNISLLQAGEYLISNENKTKIKEWFRYSPKPQANKSEHELIEELGHILDRAIKRAIDICNGNKIWVPLSGGLDSRIILAKLKEHNCPNLQCFSYGTAGNFEAQKAKEVAAILNVPWQMITAEPSKAQSLYNTETRKNYDHFAANYSCAPTFTEFEALYLAKQKGIIKDGDFIINGQTGDFISGGHVNESFYDSKSLTIDDALNYAVKKHFSLWPHLQTPDNKQSIKSANSCYFENCDGSRESIMAAYETFEWRERQTKMVVHAQRCYDYFGLKWTLPLWDHDIIEFFQYLDYALKRNQNLYKSYLKAYNYKGVFDTLSAKPKPWPRYKSLIMGTARIIGLLKGSTAKEQFYKKMLYHGDLHNQYALFPKTRYFKDYKYIRNINSFIVEDYLNKHNITFQRPDDE